MKKPFSQRIGLLEPKLDIQIDYMSDDLRNSLWNVIHVAFDHQYHNNWMSLAQFTAVHFSKTLIDEVPGFEQICKSDMRKYFLRLDWNYAYEYLEFLVDNYNEIVVQEQVDDLEQYFNYILEREFSGYRFISGVLAPITNETELNEISEAVERSEELGFIGAKAHLQTAIGLLSKRPEPDFRNSIKESISAVESVAKIIGKESSKGLADALIELSKKVSMHKSLRSGFNALYGYTSDENGIRHAILDESDIGFDEAKYMIVSCSSFVNYLISKAEASGLLSQE